MKRILLAGLLLGLLSGCAGLFNGEVAGSLFQTSHYETNCKTTNNVTSCRTGYGHWMKVDRKVYGKDSIWVDMSRPYYGTYRHTYK